MKTKEWMKTELEALEEDFEYLTYSVNLDFTEQVIKILNKKGIRHINKFLAEKLNCSPAYVTKLLKGNPNLTIQKMVEIANILDHKVILELVPKEKSEKYTRVAQSDIVTAHST